MNKFDYIGALSIIILILFSLTLIGGCPPVPDPPCCGPPNNHPEITTTFFPDGTAGEYYEAQVDTYDAEGDQVTLTLISPLQGMNLENNILTWSPRHSNIGPNFSQTGTFPIEIQADDGIDITAKVIDLYVASNTTLIDYLRTDEEVKLKWNNGTIANSNYLDQEFEAASNALIVTQQKTGAQIPINRKPIELYLSSDPSCDISTPPFYWITPEGKGMICLNLVFDAQGNGSLDTTRIEGQRIIIHEGIHGIFDWKPATYQFRFQESFAHGISGVITGSGGVGPKLTSLCDFSYSGNLFPISSDLCILYGFDMTDLPTYFNDPSRTGNIQDTYCIINDIVQTDTYQTFIDAGITVTQGNCIK